jgi:hypothetical protein
MFEPTARRLGDIEQGGEDQMLDAGFFCCVGHALPLHQFVICAGSAPGRSGHEEDRVAALQCLDQRLLRAHVGLVVVSMFQCFVR